MTREELNQCPVTAPAFAEEADHFMVCRRCGQAVDCRLLGDVLHHGESEHAPIPLNG